MDLLGILGLIQLGASLIGGFRAQQEAERRQALMDAALARQVEAALSAINTATQLANRDFAGRLSPYASLVEGRALQAARAAAGQAGLANSGLALAAAADISSQVQADLLRNLAQLDFQKMQPLLAAQTNLAQILGGQAQLQGQLMQTYGQMGPDLSWLPTLLAARPDLFNFNLDLGNLFGTRRPTRGPGAPYDLMPGTPNRMLT
jgi:hypothetical protein